jgi:iron complex outermembrane receptor protein
MMRVRTRAFIMFVPADLSTREATTWNGAHPTTGHSAASKPSCTAKGMPSPGGTLRLRQLAACVLACCSATISGQLLAGPLPAPPEETLAATSGSEQSMQTVVVTETRDKPAFDPNLPATTARVTAQQLETRNVVNPEDALKYMPNMAIRKRFTGDENASISVRGNGTSQTARGLVYADGILLSNLLGNTHTFSPRWSMIFPDDIAQVDVAYGPFSALYPGNSMGATVLVSTKMPDQLEASAKVQLFSQQFNMFGVDGHFNGNKTTASAGNRIGRLSLLVGVDHLENTAQPFVFASQALSTTSAAGTSAIPVTGAYSYTDANGAQAVALGVNAEGQEKIRQDQFKFKATYDLTPTLQAGASYGYWRQRLDNQTFSFLRDAAGNPVLSGTVSLNGMLYTLPASLFAPGASSSEHQLLGLSLKSSERSGWNYSAAASLYDVSGSEVRTANSGLASNRSGSVTFGDGTGWRSLDVSANRRPETLVPGSHCLTFGAHYDNYFLDNETYAVADWYNGGREGSFSNAFKGQTQTLAVFAQDAWQFAERWKLTSGLRYEQWRAFDGIRATATATQAYANRDISAWSPKAALSFQATPELSLRASLGRAVRFPTVSELFQGSLTGSTLVNNDPGLRPEIDFGKELSAEWERGSHSIRTSLFEDDVRDTLFSQTNTTVFPNLTNIQNIDRVRSRGLETAYSGANLYQSGIDVSASLAYTRSIILENGSNPATVGNYFYRIPLWRANLAGTWRPNEQWSLMLGGRYSGRQYNTLGNTDVNPSTFGGTSTYTVWDSKLTFKPTRHLEIGFSIDNLMNRRYYVYYPYPGRTYSLEAKVSF